MALSFEEYRYELPHYLHQLNLYQYRSCKENVVTCAHFDTNATIEMILEGITFVGLASR